MTVERNTNFWLIVALASMFVIGFILSHKPSDTDETVRTEMAATRRLVEEATDKMSDIMTLLKEDSDIAAEQREALRKQLEAIRKQLEQKP